MKTTTTDAPIVARAVRIDDARRYYLTECVDRDGGTELWLMDRTAREGNGEPFTVPEHERLGPLPRHVLDRLGLKCGAPTRHHGRPCKNPVQVFGAQCRVHAGQPVQTTLDLMTH